jgi:hypothetical protein
MVLKVANKRYRMQVREMKWGVCKVAMAMVAWFFPSPFLGTFALTNFYNGVTRQIACLQ